MKIYIPSVGLANTESWDYQQTRKSCLQDFNSLPDDNVLEGYDLMVYLGRMLFKYGKNFQYYLDAEQLEDQVYYGFEFNRIPPPLQSKSPVDDRMIPDTGFENRFVQFIQLKDFKFSQVP